MATIEDIDRILRALPDVTGGAGDGDVAWGVQAGAKVKGISWCWKERVVAGKARVPNLEVFAVRVANNAEKDLLVASEPPWLVDDPHYHGFPAVLVRLEAIDVDELEELLVDGWRALAPKRLVKQYDQAHPPPVSPPG